jgi:hypothetical protein
MNTRAPHPQSSSPGLTGRPSIPETPVMESRSRGVLDRPVKPDDDSSLWRSKTTKRSITVIAAKAGNPVFQRCLRWNREAAAYWIPRRSLSSGSPKGETRWRGMTTVCEASDLSAVVHRAKAEAAKQSRPGTAAPRAARKGEAWWGRKDSNLRSHKTADLQSAPFATRDTSPLNSIATTRRNGGHAAMDDAET